MTTKPTAELNVDCREVMVIKDRWADRFPEIEQPAPEGTEKRGYVVDIYKLIKIVESLEDRLQSSIDYSIDLQRIIEGICYSRAIPMPETGAFHHYNMAIKYLGDKNNG